MADCWRRLGAEVLDADAVAHGLLAPGGECVDAVLAAFGESVRAAEGGVDRAKLGRIVFADPARLKQLNGLLHPAVKERMACWAERIRRDGRKGVAVVPLLFEAGMASDWDAVVCVVSGEEEVLERLALRGLEPAGARARIDSQWPVREKAARADYVIENNRTLEDLETRSVRIWKTLVEEGEKSHGNT